ncbi:MAG: DUF1549 domain-containing protein, partial [Planctomycetaceae bacterium]|nr:DUF1549 domain-containing protein [Planctomycetaceae bacterium]
MQRWFRHRSFLGCVAAIAALMGEGPGTAADDAHWSLVPPVRPVTPACRDRQWCMTPIDAFIHSQLALRGLEPSSEETRARLLRRASLDLTGLPPTFEEVQAFVTDPSPDAYERAVERLLDSPHRGERLAQMWLDVVRYADSDGFEYDTARPWAWKYRDWVIAAFNEDLPYDQFVRDQIAGDELHPSNAAKQVATGLHRLGPFRENAGIQDEEKNRQELLVEMTDAVGFAFLGLTVGCAKCHDHKFDPFSQEDYYGLQAFFAGTIPADVPTADAVEANAHEARIKEWKETVDRLQQQIAELEQVTTGSEPGSPSASSAEQVVTLRSQLELLQHAEPPPLDRVMAVREMDSTIPSTFVLIRGEPGQHGPSVEPAFPASLSTASLSIPDDDRTERRAALAAWLTADDHPLTARVMVNRLWQLHFGRGLVATPND